MKDLMQGVNCYGKTLLLDASDIKSLEHRALVGGLWEELGSLQLDFMIKQGLRPEDKLLDLGCGCLRGGVKLINYLDCQNYIGVDINSSLLSAGETELEKLDLLHKKPLLIESDDFGRSCNKFYEVNYAMSISLFTHLPVSYIQEALMSVKSKLADNGQYYATFFVCNDMDDYFHAKLQHPGEILTYAHRDPFHINVDLVRFISNQVGLDCTYLGDWNHPRNQKMFKFTKIIY